MRQFEPWVQPIVDLNSGVVVGMEVLMRWRHPHRGIVAPSEFIAIAERTGLIGRMSVQTMSKAAMQLAPVFRACPSLYLSVNVTPWQLRQPGFASTLREIFNDDTVSPSQVLLEVTERDIVDASARSTLFDLRAQGWRLAIDDFGTGHSSLAVLESLPVDRLKIDRAFVSSIGEQTASRPVLDAVIEMARSLGIALIAEGIETSAQWDYLRAQGVGSAQGYMIAKPMPIESFTQWLAERGEIDPEVLDSESPDTSPASGMSSMLTTAPGTLSMPGTTANEAQALSTSHGTWHAEVATLWERIVRERGVELRDRVHALRIYRNCFIARDAVDWLVQDQQISRKEAVRIGRHWVARGWLRHVHDEHDFADAVLFFAPCVQTRVKADEIPSLMSLVQSAKTNDHAGPLPLGDVVRGLLIHRRCMTGRNLVNWTMNLHPVTRAQATQWARTWMQQGRIRHIYDDREFVDGPELYRLS
jgi:EAL domain-containing protein (putative c-di-GMP-specific phosphodiesterase class I)